MLYGINQNEKYSRGGPGRGPGGGGAWQLTRGRDPGGGGAWKLSRGRGLLGYPGRRPRRGRGLKSMPGREAPPGMKKYKILRGNNLKSQPQNWG